MNTSTKEINIKPFEIYAESFQIQLLDLKSKGMWSGKLTELERKLKELEIQKYMHVAQHKWAALNKCYNLRHLFSTHRIFFQNTITFSCMNIIKSKVIRQLINTNLESCLKLKSTSYELDVTKLSKISKANAPIDITIYYSINKVIL